MALLIPFYQSEKLFSLMYDGYEENLLTKISIYDENMNVVKLPNSTCIIVIEKE